MITNWKAWIISSLVLFGTTLAVIRPSYRVTEPERPEQFQLVQQEIYNHLNQLNLIQHGEDSCASNTVTIYLVEKYITSAYTVMVSNRWYALADTVNKAIGASPLTDSSFVVYGTTATHKFYWTTFGVKK